MTEARVSTDLRQTGFNATDEEIKAVVEIHEGIIIGRMPTGTKQGRSSVMISGRDKDGRLHVIETTMRIFLHAAEAFQIVEAMGPGADN